MLLIIKTWLGRIYLWKGKIPQFHVNNSFNSSSDLVKTECFSCQDEITETVCWTWQIAWRIILGVGINVGPSLALLSSRVNVENTSRPAGRWPLLHHHWSDLGPVRLDRYSGSIQQQWIRGDWWSESPYWSISRHFITRRLTYWLLFPYLLD